MTDANHSETLPLRAGSQKPRTVLVLSLWLAAFGAALALDRPVAQYVHDQGWDMKKSWKRRTVYLAEAIKLPGTYRGTAAVMVVVFVICARRSRRNGFQAAALLGVTGTLTGFNGLIKWLAGRRRPAVGIQPFDLDPFPNGLAGLLGNSENLCFPSGHACVAIATATVLAMLFPRWKWAFFAVAVVTSVERIVENAQWVSDVVAGAAMGVVCAKVAWWGLATFAKSRRVRLAEPAYRNSDASRVDSRPRR